MVPYGLDAVVQAEGGKGDVRLSIMVVWGLSGVGVVVVLESFGTSADGILS